MTPHDRGDDPVRDALRAALRRHADDAPPAGDVVGRTLTAAARRPARRRREWRTWGLPVLAAGAVAAVVGVVVAVQQHPRPQSAPPAVHRSAASYPAPTGSASRAVVPPTVTRSATGRGHTSPTAAAALHGVRVADLTFVDADHGWALGSAACLTGSGRCTAVLRTTDGRTWTGVPGATFNVPGVRGCADPCVQGLRFATGRIGYAYGPDALFMTTDGGASWQRQGTLGADALETADGNVIAVHTANTAHPTFQRAPIGSSRWTSVGAAATAAATSGTELAFARAGAHAVVLVPGHFSPGFRLVRSADDGATWASTDAQCPRVGAAHLEAGALAVAPDGTVSVACSDYSTAGGRHGAVLRSGDGGASFARRDAGSATPGLDLLAAASPDVLVGYSAGRTYRSTDGGRTWSRVSPVSGQVIFVGFESRTVGRLVTDGGRTVWTTRDAGATWSRVQLP